MNRVIAFLLAVSMLFSAFALAKESPVLEPKAEIAIDNIYKTLDFHGEESLTHGWIVADVTITNYSLHTISVKDDITAELIYGGMYEFSAEPVFAVSQFEPLVRLSGEIVFKVPKLVLEAENDKLSAALTVDGQTVPLEFNQAEGAKPSGSPEIFKTPEDLLVCYIDCLKNADFEGLIGLFSHEEKAKNTDFEKALGSYRLITIEMDTKYPAYEQYQILTALDYLPLRQIFFSVFSLLAGLENTGGGPIIQYKNGVLTGMEVFPGEEMTTEEYTSRLNPERLGGLSLESIYRSPVDPEGRLYKNTMKNSFIYDYSDKREFILCVSFEGQRYYLGATLLRFDDGWKIDSLSAGSLNNNWNVQPGAFASEENVNPVEADSMILTWENGERISENALKDSVFSKDALLGTWTCAEGAVSIDEKYITSNEDGDALLYRITEDYLYMFTDGLSSPMVLRIELTEDTLTLYAGEDTLVFRKER